MPKTVARPRSGRPIHPVVALIVSRYNASITDRLRDGALAEYASRYPSAPSASVVLVDAPGSYELPALALAAMNTGRFDGAVALGCLIKGETSHDRYIAQAVAHGLVEVTVATGLPVAFGVLTVDTPAQAKARAGGSSGNKGQEAMAALLDTVEQIRLLHSVRVTAVASARRSPPDKLARRPRSRS